ncbi:DUF2169 family type VI secretion system accessory protein [Aliiroseovarius sp.]|uniref:DUF2169 family type VI secretion system accessory protein n=1 Tax=Aliiroseovarius sp. TaxID=1872442 RepID=UPI003BAB37FC
MLHDNNTPFAALAFDQWHPNGSTMAVVSARARITIAPDGAQFYVPDVELVLADKFAGDPHKTPLLLVNDLIPYKPSADVTLAATLQAAEPTTSLLGQVRAGDRTTTIRGVGERKWFFDTRWRLSDPEPIQSLDVCYTKASGGRIIGDPDGEVDPENPIGAGVVHPEYTPKSREYVAPQIDDPNDPITGDINSRPRVVGLGAVPPWWARRLSFAGTYDKEWEDNVHPRLPTDFDYRHYQVAPSDLVLNGYILPGMTVETSGFRPNGAAFSFQIPDIAAVARFSFTDGREVWARLHIDGLHLDLTQVTPTYDLTMRTWIETCPSLYRVDLDVMTQKDAADLRLPVSGHEGLIEAG